MTLLSIITNACNELGIPAPTTVETTTDPRAITLKALARREQIELARRYDWPSMVLEHTFATAVGTSQYGLPTDFDKLIRDTAYNSAEFYRLRGGLTPAEWRYIAANNSLLTSGSFRISATAISQSIFRIEPTPTLVELMIYEYKTVNSGYTVTDDGQGGHVTVGVPFMSLNVDTTRLDESLIELGLKWRWLKAKGLDYGEEFRTYNEAVDLRYAQDIALPTVPLAPRRVLDDAAPMTDGYVPDRGYGA